MVLSTRGYMRTCGRLQPVLSRRERQPQTIPLSRLRTSAGQQPEQVANRGNLFRIGRTAGAGGQMQGHADL